MVFKINATFADKLGLVIKKPIVNKVSKYKNTRVVRDGFNFPSKLEAAYYSQLREHQKSGKVSFFLMQVPTILNPTGYPKKRYVCDFLVFYPDGSYAFIEIKGKETEKFKLQKAIFEEVYNVPLTVIYKGDF